MDEVEFHASPRESKSKRWLSFHPFSGMYILYIRIFIYIYIHMYMTPHFVCLLQAMNDEPIQD